MPRALQPYSPSSLEAVRLLREGKSVSTVSKLTRLKVQTIDKLYYRWIVLEERDKARRDLEQVKNIVGMLRSGRIGMWSACEMIDGLLNQQSPECRCEGELT